MLSTRAWHTPFLYFEENWLALACRHGHAHFQAMTRDYEGFDVTDYMSRFHSTCRAEAFTWYDAGIIFRLRHHA